MKKKKIFSRGVMFLLCLVFSVLFLLPTVLTFTNSFMSESEIRSNYGMIFSSTGGGFVSERVNLKFIPDRVTLSQYVSGLIKSPNYLLKYWNSILLVLPIVILQVAIASVAAYSFTRWRGRIRDSIFFFYVILMLMPYQVTLVPNFLVSQWLGIINTPWSIILPGMFAPFSVFLLTKFMRRIPYSLIEAAKVDGASEWAIFTKICLPECRSLEHGRAAADPSQGCGRPAAVGIPFQHQFRRDRACLRHGERVYDPLAAAFPPWGGISGGGHRQPGQRQRIKIPYSLPPPRGNSGFAPPGADKAKLEFPQPRRFAA